MPKFAANLTMLFNELPFLERFEAAAQAGFKAVEFLFPYDFRKEQVAAALKDNGLALVLHNLPAGDWDAGERGIACHPGSRRRSSATASDRPSTTPRRSDCPQVNCLAGIRPAGVSAEKARATSWSTTCATPRTNSRRQTSAC